MKNLVIATGILAAILGCRKGDEPATRSPAATPVPPIVLEPEKMFGETSGLKEPRGVGVDAKGQVFIGDTGNQRVVSLDATGKELGPWGGWTPQAVLADLAVTPDGQVVTLNVTTGDVEVFGPDGKPGRRLAAVATSASGIAVGPDGRIWVADTGQSRVLRFTSEGTPDGVFVGTGSANGQFEQPIDVAVAPDGTAYVLDLRHRIVRLAPDGQIAAEWKVEHGLARGGSHLAVWRGLVVMTDPDRHRLGILDPASGVLRFVGAEGNGPGKFRVPVGIAAGADNKLYVVDSDNARVQVFSDLEK